MCTEIADFGTYKSVGCWRAAFAIFTASFTLLKLIRSRHGLKSSCSWHKALFVNWEKWEQQECFTTGQWPGLPGAQFWNGIQTSKPPAVTSQIWGAPYCILWAKGTLPWLCCLFPATTGGGDSHMSHDWVKGGFHLKSLWDFLWRLKVFFCISEKTPMLLKSSHFSF